MNREQILAMEPGHGLNVLVAEKIFKKKVDLSRASDKVVWNEGGLWTWLKDYSTDIVAAWGLVEKMQAEEWDFALTNFKRLVHKRRYNATFGTSYSHKADTAPEAICKAALFAILDMGDPA